MAVRKPTSKPPTNKQEAQAAIEELLSEFSDAMKAGDRLPDFEPFLERCPEGARRELQALMNTLVLAQRALASERRDAVPAPARR